MKIGLETDQHKNKEKEVIEPIEQEANEPIEEIKFELLEEDIEIEQHQNNEQQNFKRKIKNNATRYAK